MIVLDGLNADFIKIFSHNVFQKAIFTSILLALLSAFITVIAALIFSNLKRNFTSDTRLASKPYAKVFNIIISFSSNLYLAIPSLVLGLGVFLMYQNFNGQLLSWSIFALVFANVLMSLPFALAVLSSQMHKTAKRYDKLSFSLNISGFKRWKYVEYPYIKQSLAYIFALSFCFSLGDLGIIALFGSDEFITLPWYLYQLIGSYNTKDASGVALILLTLVLCVFILIPRLFRNKNA